MISRAYPGENPMYRSTNTYPAATNNAGIITIKNERFMASLVS